MPTTSKVTIQLDPHQAMQLLRWKKFLEDAITDPYHDTQRWDRAGILDALQELDAQVRARITPEQLDDAVAQQEVNKLINKQP